MVAVSLCLLRKFKGEKEKKQKKISSGIEGSLRRGTKKGEGCKGKEHRQGNLEKDKICSPPPPPHFTAGVTCFLETACYFLFNIQRTNDMWINFSNCNLERQTNSFVFSAPDLCEGALDMLNTSLVGSRGVAYLDTTIASKYVLKREIEKAQYRGRDLWLVSTDHIQHSSTHTHMYTMNHEKQYIYIYIYKEQQAAPIFYIIPLSLFLSLFRWLGDLMTPSPGSTYMGSSLELTFFFLYSFLFVFFFFVFLIFFGYERMVGIATLLTHNTYQKRYVYLHTTTRWSARLSPHRGLYGIWVGCHAHNTYSNAFIQISKQKTHE
eukprot:gene8943-6275_t